MHEWIQYRDKRVKQAEVEAEVEVEEKPEEEAEAQADDEALAAERQRVEQAREIAATLELGSSESARQRLQALIGRQQRLPLEVVEEPTASKGSPRLTETRQELVQRLMDPALSLQEAAVLLGVCATTVRRYTNRGALRCYRTPGNQRRFRLSDVLDFMEHRQDDEIYSRLS